MTDLGLRVPSVTGVSLSEEATIHSKWDTIDWARHQMQEVMGLVPATEPQYACPVIDPGSLSTLNNDDYAILYEKLLNWLGYVTERFADVKAMVIQSKNEMEYIEVVTKDRMMKQAVGSGSKKPTGEQMNVAVQTDQRYEELAIINQKYQQLYDMLQGRVNTLEANLKAVSRHIELRKLEQDKTRLGGNLNNRGREDRAGFRRA